MITIYKEKNNKLVNLFKEDNEAKFKCEKRTWIDITFPTESLLKDISEQTKINLPFLLVSLDPEESARTDKEDNDSLIVLDVPVEKELEHKKGNYDTGFETVPFIIVYNENYIVTISKRDTKLVSQFLKKTKIVEPHKHTRFTLYMMFALAQQFIQCLKKIDNESREVEDKLQSSMKNKEIFDLMALNKMLVYFSTALNSDKIVLERLMKSPSFKQFDDDIDLMDDVLVELNQAIEMCTIYRDILSGMMDAFASIISNNLNIVMKVLAIITIVLSIPTLVASFYGMNVKNIPLGDNNYAFWIIIGISAALAVVAGLILYIVEHRRKF